MVTMKKVITLIIFIIGGSIMNAQNVKVISSGQGKTEDEATKIALRSALEEAFGTFISSSTEIVNDVLVSDEIVSITQGNIKEYKIISSSRLEKRIYSVTVESIVSLSKLSAYCESKGMSVNFDLTALAMDLKMKEFNRENERKVLKNLCKQILLMDPQIFDFKLKTAKPIIQTANAYVPILIMPSCNSNYKQMNKILKSTLQSISLNKQERDAYDNLGQDYDKKGWETNTSLHKYYFRNSACRKILDKFFYTYIYELVKNCEIVDNFSIVPLFMRHCKPYLIVGKDKPYNLFGKNEVIFNFYPKSESQLFLLKYTQDEFTKLKSIDLKPFDIKQYEASIKPKLLKIIAEFDNIK